VHYRHLFHAGNFADVFKHVTLLALLQALSRKDKPWCMLDTHAGAGLYDLRRDEAARTGEWQDGIGRLWAAPPAEPLLQRYIELLRDANDGAGLQRYPGSPWLAARLARPGDRVVACERVPEVAAALAEILPQVELHRRDGYESHALLPPREKRGLVLIDPPFERADEFDAAAAFMQRAGARFAGGVQALWYPLKNRHAAGRCLRRLARDSGREVIDLQIDTGRVGAGRMHACGMAVVNPPYGFEADIHPALQALAGALEARVELAAVTV